MRLSGRPLLPQFAWHVLAILVFLCLPMLKLKAVWWQLPRAELIPLVFLTAGYATAALAVMIFARPGTPRAFGRAVALSFSIFGLFVLVLSLTRLDPPRYLLLPMFLAIIVAAPLMIAPRIAQFAGIAVLSIALLSVAAVGGRTVLARPHASAAVVSQDVKTALYVLRLRSHDGVIPHPATRGGGLDRLDDRLLFGTGDGHLYTLRVGADDIKARELRIRVPANREEFARAFNGSASAPRAAREWREEVPEVQTWRFRVADVIAQVDGDNVRIFASHHFWKQQEQCFVVRVSELATRLSELEGLPGPGRWQTVFESHPCLPLHGAGAMRGKNPFRGEEIGGRMMLLDANTLLLTQGDQGFSGIEGSPAYAQDPQATYGKTIRIDLRTRAASLNTLGHRNPQGLYAAPDGRIWETEHSAQGGDELNLLQTGANYGWPLVTYGTDYGSMIWPLSQQQGRHDGYQQPVYAWLPGIGISNLVQLQGDRFPIWRGNLIIGTLSAHALFRVVLDGDRAVVTEPIPIQKRVRDVQELDDGRLLLWTDEASLVTIEPVVATGPAVQFSTACSGCHRISDGYSHRLGPDLYELLDRKVASAENFDAYSPALKKLGGQWDKQRLDRFLRDPQAMVPGTSMAFPGIADDQERAALVDWILTTSKVGGQ